MNHEVFKTENSIVVSEVELRYSKIKTFFETINDVVKVSSNKTIDYEYIKKSMPKKVGDRPNIYGIYAKKGDEEWELKYIGQRKQNGILQRLNNHLHTDNEGTQSKNSNVKGALSEGYEIGVKLFYINPDSMRLYYEEKLISDLCQNNWNK